MRTIADRVEELMLRAPSEAFKALMREVVKRYLEDGNEAWADARLRRIEGELDERDHLRAAKEREAAESAAAQLRQAATSSRQRYEVEQLVRTLPTQPQVLALEKLRAGDVAGAAKLATQVQDALARRAEAVQAAGEPVVWFGEWQRDVEYPAGSMVLYLSHVYVARRDTREAPISPAEDWVRLTSPPAASFIPPPVSGVDTSDRFAISAAFMAPDAPAAVVAWRAPTDTFALAVRVFVRGDPGAGAAVNARVPGGDLLPADYVSTGTDSWEDGGAVQNSLLSAGDFLELVLVDVAGTPDEVTVQVDLLR